MTGWWLRLRRSDAGLSLVELLVTMVLAAATLPLIFAVVIRAQAQAEDTQDTAASVDRVRLAMATVQREVRAGAAPVSLSAPLWTGRPERLAFGFWTSSTTAAGRCVQYKVVGADLVRRTWTPAVSPVPQPAPPAWPAPGATPAAGVTRVISGLTASTTPSSSVTSWFEPAVVTQVETEAVRIVLEVRDGSGHPATATTVVATRNLRPIPLPVPDPCATF